jgi:glycerol-3-phosphate acyltransferase PlsY
MVFSVHLQRLAVVAIVICHDHSQFIGFRSLKPAAPQWIWLFQEALFVKVMAITPSFFVVCMIKRMRSVKTRVFPEPADARTLIEPPKGASTI